jgi:SAM-dependent methyltransferase
MTLLDEIRQYWDVDSATYDQAAHHRPTDPMVRAAWAGSMEDALPPTPSRVLDCGAGTGFLSLIAARLGHHVTAVDLSTGMTDRLRSAAEAEGLDIKVVITSAETPPLPDGAAGYDAVMERHLLWTMPDPAGALRAWREATVPGGRLVLVESFWGTHDPIERRRSKVHQLIRKARARPSDHHRPYDPEVNAALPLAGGTPPARLIEMVEAAGWANPRLRRMEDVEWAERCALPMPDRIVGVTPRYTVIAG